MLEPRNALNTLKAYESPAEGDARLRLHLNENTFGCSETVLQALRGLTAEELARYPQREPVEKLVAESLGITPQQVLLTNGADEGLHLACTAYLEQGMQAVTAVPTFSLYSTYTRATGAELVEVPSLADFAFPVEGVLQAVNSKTRMVLIANPNNPTGACVTEADILRIAKAAPQAAVLADEAYFEFYGKSVIRHLDTYPNLMVARTFSKAYGLAGLRVGYLAGSERQISALRRICSPFNVNVAALRCAAAGLADETYMRGYVNAIVEGRQWLREQLTKLGVESWPSHANFVLARFAARRENFLEAARREGILIRDRDDQPLCRGCVRISIGSQQQNQRVIEIAKRCSEIALAGAE